MELGKKYLNTTTGKVIFISEIDETGVRLSIDKKHYTDDFQTISGFKRLVSAGAFEEIAE